MNPLPDSIPARSRRGLVLRARGGGRTAIRVVGRDLSLVLRQTFGGIPLLGLEVLVAADLLRTVAIAPARWAQE
jgi:hypothetical protein